MQVQRECSAVWFLFSSSPVLVSTDEYYCSIAILIPIFLFSPLVDIYTCIYHTSNSHKCTGVNGEAL